MKKWEKVKENLKSNTKEDQQVLDIFSKLIGKLIKRRKELKISQKKLSKISKVGITTINRIETGEIKPQITTLIKLTIALDIEIKLENLT
jgi:predicted transcriptional regulator